MSRLRIVARRQKREGSLEDMEISTFTEDVLKDRLEGWELVEFLQVPISSIVEAAVEYDWINEENLEDLIEFVGLKG